MHTVVGAYEAKTHLPRLLEQVERGDSVTITRHGHPVARLVGVRGSGGAADADPVAAFAAARAGRTLGIPVRDALATGRR